MKELVYSRFLLPAANRHAGATAFIEDHDTETFGSHVERSVRLAHALHKTTGLTADDRFAVVGANSRRYLNLWHAALLGGGVITPLNPRLAPPELRSILSDSGARVVFCDARFAPAVDEARGHVPSIEKVFLIDADNTDVSHDGRLDDLVATGEAALVKDPDEDDPAFLLYTGGTTGAAKGVLHTQRSTGLTLHRLAQLFDYHRPGTVFLGLMPLFHAGACPVYLGMPTTGNTTVLQAGFDPAAVLAAYSRHRVTHAALAPTMWAAVTQHPDFGPETMASARTIAYGGSPMPAPLVRRLLDTLPDVSLIQVFGMTESGGLLSALTADDHRSEAPRLGSVGRPLPGVDLAVFDDTGEAVPTGTVGEVCARAGSITPGYHRRPAETAAAFRHGWYRTGDLGRLDEDGYLYLVDRAKDMIVTGAENVYSAEVEQALASHPAVAQVAVIGIPDDRWGEAVHAIVVPRPGTTVATAELLTHARERIANYKVPKSVDLRAEPLPVSAAGKILKRALREPFWTGRLTRIN